MNIPVAIMPFIGCALVSIGWVIGAARERARKPQELPKEPDAYQRPDFTETGSAEIALGVAHIAGGNWLGRDNAEWLLEAGRRLLAAEGAPPTPTPADLAAKTGRDPSSTPDVSDEGEGL